MPRSRRRNSPAPGKAPCETRGRARAEAVYLNRQWRGQEPGVAGWISDAVAALAVGLVGRSADRCRTGFQRALIDGIHVAHVIMQSRGHGPELAVGFAHFEDGVAEADFCMLDGAAGLLAVHFHFFRSEGLLQKIEELPGARRVQVRVDAPQALGNMAGPVMRGDVPMVAEWIPDTAGALSVRHFLDRVQRGGPRGQRPLVSAVRIRQIQVNRSGARRILLISVAQLDHGLADLDLRVHDAASVRRGDAEFLFRSEHLLHEFDKLRRAWHDDVRREGVKTLAQWNG